MKVDASGGPTHGQPIRRLAPTTPDDCLVSRVARALSNRERRNRRRKTKKEGLGELADDHIRGNGAGFQVAVPVFDIFKCRLINPLTDVLEVVCQCRPNTWEAHREFVKSITKPYLDETAIRVSLVDGADLTRE